MRRTLAFLAIACSIMVASASPEFFSHKPYAEAKAFATKQDRLFFVKGTAVWCGPCKMMDRTTFKDERVIDWLVTHTVPVAVDVDKQPRIAQQLRIRAMPTMILFKGDEELGRVVGYRDAGQLLAWLDSVDSGTIQAVPPPEPADIRGRMKRAKDLFFNGESEKATAEYVWLWQHMLDHQPSMSGVRVSFMAGDMADLAEESPHARTAFATLRDETEDRLKAGPKTWQDLRDWLVLNERVLHEREPILAWIDRIKDRPTARRTFARVGDIVDEVLRDEGRWALYGELIDNPDAKMARAESIYQMTMRMAKSDPRPNDGSLTGMAEERDIYAQMYRDEAGSLHAALLAAGRDDEAWAVAGRAVKFMDDIKTRATLIDTAEKAGVLQSRHLDLLDEKNPEHTTLIRRVRAATGG